MLRLYANVAHAAAAILFPTLPSTRGTAHLAQLTTVVAGKSIQTDPGVRTSNADEVQCSQPRPR